MKILWNKYRSQSKGQEAKVRKKLRKISVYGKHDRKVEDQEIQHPTWESNNMRKKGNSQKIKHWFPN